MNQVRPRGYAARVVDSVVLRDVTRCAMCSVDDYVYHAILDRLSILSMRYMIREMAW